MSGFDIFSVYVSMGMISSMLCLWMCNEKSAFRRMIRKMSNEGEIDRGDARRAEFIMDEISETPVLIFILVCATWPIFTGGTIYILVELVFDIIAEKIKR
jgi:hypothetical protein